MNKKQKNLQNKNGKFFDIYCFNGQTKCETQTISHENSCCLFELFMIHENSEFIYFVLFLSFVVYFPVRFLVIDFRFMVGFTTVFFLFYREHYSYSVD